MKPAGASRSRDPLTNIALCIEELGAGGQVPEAVVDQATVGVGDVRPAAPGSVATKQRVHDRLGRVEPDLGLAVVLQAREGVEEAGWFVRGSPAAAGELTDAVEPGEQSLAVERDRGWWLIEGWLRHRARIERVRMRRKGALAGDNHSSRVKSGARPAISTSWWFSPRLASVASVHAYLAAMHLKFRKKALREAERELDAAAAHGAGCRREKVDAGQDRAEAATGRDPT